MNDPADRHPSTAAHLSGRFKHPAFPAYKRLRQGLGAVSPWAIVSENRMLHFNVAQQLRHGSIAAVGVSVDRTSGGPTDFWLRRRGPW